jgi:Protein of unknown function (DUF3723)
MDPHLRTDILTLRDRHQGYQGRAKIRLRNLRAEPTARDLDQDVVRELVQKFHLTKCRRLESENVIPAVLEPALLQRALAASNLERLEPSSTVEPPFLDLGDDQITFLHGKHRIEAARRVLSRLDAYWIVELYTDRTFSQTPAI